MQRSFAAVHPGREHHIVEIADMVVMVMRDEDRTERIERHAGFHCLQHHPASGIEQDVLVTETDQRRRRIASGVGTRTAGPEKNNLEHRIIGRV